LLVHIEEWQIAAARASGYIKERTLKLVVTRQAQRGDFCDALEALTYISSAEERDKALELVVSAQVDAGELKQAEALLSRIEEKALRTECRERIQRAFARPLPIEEDYAERVIEQRRRDSQVGERVDGVVSVALFGASGLPNTIGAALIHPFCETH
jgi:hypothetical protein